MSQRQTDGKHAEDLALAHLLRQGLYLVARNWHCPQGEWDLILRDAHTLIFVEVRYRRSNSHGGAAASVDFRKRTRLIRTAQAFLQQHPALQLPCRFDVVTLQGDLNTPHLDWLRQAFEA